MANHIPSLSEILEQASKGNVSLEFAAAHLEKYLQSLADVEYGFLGSLTLQPPETAQRCWVQADSVKRLLGSLRSLGETAAASVRQGSLADLVPLADQIQAATHDLNLEMAAYREASLIALGPTGLAGINLIARSVAAVLDQPDNPKFKDDLGFQIDKELQRVESAQFSADQSEEFTTALNGLEGALKGLEAASSSNLEAALDALLDQADAFEEVLKRLQTGDDLGQGPSSHARINVLLNTAERVWDGQVEIAALIEACEDLQRSLEIWRSQLGSVLRRFEPSPMVAQQAQALDGEYKKFEELLANFRHSVEDEDGEVYDGLCQGVVAGWNQVAALQHSLQNEMEKQGKIPCARCGYFNSKDSRACEQCEGILPKLAQERAHGIDIHATGEAARETGGPVEMPENLTRILSAVDDFLAGSLAREEFQAEVARLHGLVQQAQAEPQSGNLFAEGLQDMEAGLGFLEQMSHSGETTIAETGARLIWEGSGKIQAALKGQSK